MDIRRWIKEDHKKYPGWFDQRGPYTYPAWYAYFHRDNTAWARLKRFMQFPG